MGEIISQSFHFVDAPATQGGTAGVSRQLTKCKNVDVKDDRKTEVVMAVGVDQGAGFRDKQGGGEITFVQFRETGKAPEVDWRGFKTDRKTFTWTIQDELNGLRESFTCRVSEVSSKDDDQGVHEDNVTLVYTKRYKS